MRKFCENWSFRLGSLIWIMGLCLFFSSCKQSKPISVDELLEKSVNAGAEGNWQQAKEYAKDAVKLDAGNADALVVYAISLNHCGQPEKAFDEARKAQKIGSDNFMAQYYLGKILFDNECYADCISPLKFALRLKPNSPEVLALLAKSSAELKLDEAFRYYNELRKLPQFAEAAEPYNELATLFIEKKQLPGAAKCLLKAYKLAPKNPTVVLNLAIFCDRNVKKPKTAKKYYEEYLMLTESNSELIARREEVKARLLELGTK